jgi:hypothetical protein
MLLLSKAVTQHQGKSNTEKIIVLFLQALILLSHLNLAGATGLVIIAV